jgi:hypothetical protein
MAIETAEAPRAAARSRPIGVMILAGLAAIALALAAAHLLQAIGLLPYFVGSIAIRDFNIWYALMWGAMIWVWAWVVRALLDVDPSAWLFLLVVSGFNLMFDFFSMIGASSATTDLSASFIVNLIIFGYTVLPGTKRSFGLA